MRRLYLMLICASALALLSGLCAHPAFAEPTVTKISGKAEILKSGSSRWQALKQQATLKSGDSIRATSGQVTLRDNQAKTAITVEPGSQLNYAGSIEAKEGMKRPPSGTPVPCYIMPQGEADVSVTPGHSLDLITPLILTSVRGTRYQAKAELDGSSSVKVIEGVVRVRDRLGVEKSLRAGESHGLSTRDFTSAVQKMPRSTRATNRPRGGGGGTAGADSSGAGGDDGGDDGDDGGDDGGDDD